MSERAVLFALLKEAIRAAAELPTSRDHQLTSICTTLRDGVGHYDWVGFYLVDETGENLVLGPFAGASTEHVRIAFGEGICGQAARRRETFVVQDVSRETNYLSCSPEVNSEIVLPLFKDGALVGELDIDSHRLSAFGDEDRAFLEAVCEIAAGLF